MSVVLPDRRVVEAIGPYISDSKNNDARITRHIISTHQRPCQLDAERQCCHTRSQIWGLLQQYGNDWVGVQNAQLPSEGGSSTYCRRGQ